MSSELNSKEISGTIQRFFLLEINILAAHPISKSKMISRRQGGGDPACAGQTSGVYVSDDAPRRTQAFETVSQLLFCHSVQAERDTESSIINGFLDTGLRRYDD